MTPDEAIALAGRQAHVRVYDGAGLGTVMAEGRVIGYAPHPSLLLQHDDGSQSAWMTTLPIEEIPVTTEPTAQTVEDTTTDAGGWVNSLGFEEQDAVHAAKRLAVDWTPWMGDWFVSSSPRNSNTHAEGTWDHWVDLALKILRDPLTGIVRPAAHAAVAEVEPIGFYDESSRGLTDDELMARFRRTA